MIREGATLIQTAEDVLEALAPGAIPVPRRSSPVRDRPVAAVEAGHADRSALTGLLGPTPVPVDELIRQSGLTPALVPTILLELELAGRLERHAGGKVSLP